MITMNITISGHHLRRAYASEPLDYHPQTLPIASCYPRKRPESSEGTRIACREPPGFNIFLSRRGERVNIIVRGRVTRTHSQGSVGYIL